MTLSEFTLMQIVTLFGGVTVVLVGLAAFLGKVWLKRISEREKGEIQKEFARLQSELALTTKAVEARLAHSSNASKLQFEHEFKAFQQIWPVAVQLYDATMNLRHANGVANSKRAEAFKAASEAFGTVLKLHRPFIPRDVRSTLTQFADLCEDEKSWFDDYSRGDASLLETDGDPRKIVLAFAECDVAIACHIESVGIPR